MKQITKACKTCKAEFIPKTNQKYCNNCKVEANTEYKRKYRKEYYKTNSEKMREAGKKWRKNNPESIKNLLTKWRKKNPEKVLNINYRKAGYKLNGIQFTVSDFNDLITIQENKCKGCKVDFDNLPKKEIHIDHNHLTGNVRGILCRNCNLVIGYAKDNKETLAELIKYLD